MTDGYENGKFRSFAATLMEVFESTYLHTSTLKDDLEITVCCELKCRGCLSCSLCCLAVARLPVYEYIYLFTSCC